MPSIEKLVQRHKEENFKVLLINMKEDRETIRSFLNRNQYSPSVLLDTNGTAAKDYSVYGIPVSFLIDKRSEVVFRFIGNLNWESEKMISLVQSLLDE